jgi:hypothetical protein
MDACMSCSLPLELELCVELQELFFGGGALLLELHPALRRLQIHFVQSHALVGARIALCTTHHMYGGEREDTQKQSTKNR